MGVKGSSAWLVHNQRTFRQSRLPKSRRLRNSTFAPFQMNTRVTETGLTTGRMVQENAVRRQYEITPASRPRAPGSHCSSARTVRRRRQPAGAG
jgi:hypothetical protein